MAGEAVDTDVLIAGLGPVGATLGVYLARAGLSVTICERDRDVYPLPRAAHLDHEVMRLLHMAGGADAVLAASQSLSTYEFRNRAGELLMGFRSDPLMKTTGFPQGNMFHQPTLELALRAELAREPNATVHLGASVTGFTDNGDTVAVEVKGDDGPRSLTARFLIGCDGGGSLVRRIAGITLEDMDFDEPWLVIDAVLKNGVTRLSSVGLQHCDPARPVTSMPMAPGRHRWEFMMLPGETAEDVTSDAVLNELVRPFADPAALEIERRAVYRFHAVTAREWRKGRVLIAGDAAHQMPPFMGQGLCSGVRDAANLGWKLIAVLKGDAPLALLDTYQPERDPHVRAITALAIFMGRIVCLQNEEEAARRDVDMTSKPEAERMGGGLPPLDGLKTGIVAGHPAAGQIAPEPRLADGRRIDEVIGLAPYIVTRGARPSSFAARGYVFGMDQVMDTHGALAALMGDAPAILVRPDRLVFGAGEARALVEAWAAYLGQRVPA
jgi:3-(3-hydroxy-phenyl)propionate hydroxylase